MPAKILILESPLVVAHVYQKMYEAREAGIDMELDLRCGLQDLKIPEIYLIEVLGNLLGNAMDEILAIPGVTIADVGQINRLQKCIRANRVVSFFASEAEGAQE